MLDYHSFLKKRKEKKRKEKKKNTIIIGVLLFIWTVILGQSLIGIGIWISYL